MKEQEPFCQGLVKVWTAVTLPPSPFHRGGNRMRGVKSLVQGHTVSSQTAGMGTWQSASEPPSLSTTSCWPPRTL